MTAGPSRGWGRRQLPELLPGEQLLWEGQPAWRAVARHVFRVPVVAAYFTALTLLDMWIVRGAEGPGWPVMMAAKPTVVSGAACLLVLGALSWAVGRTTTYALTTHRVVMLFGLALPATLSIPLHRIAGSSARMRRGTGDIALTLKDASGPGIAKLWPHVRPWSFRRPEPMLRDLPGAGVLAPLLCRALAAADARHTSHADSGVAAPPAAAPQGQPACLALAEPAA